MKEKVSSNPYEAYFQSMLEMQQEMTNAYIAASQAAQASGAAPMWPPHMHPAFAHPPMPGHFPHPMRPAMGYPGAMPPPPHWPDPAFAPQGPPPNTTEESGPDPLLEQAQAMLEGALGEEAGMFNEILGSFGMSDKEFWKGAVVGAAAAMLLSNENVRSKLMGLVSGAGDMLKTGGESVKDAAVNTASNVKDNVATSGEIFRDTVSAGKQGFQESVEKHRAEPVAKPLADHQPEPEPRSVDTDEPVIKEQ